MVEYTSVDVVASIIMGNQRLLIHELALALLLVLQLQALLFSSAASGAVVKSLPGFEGPLPFHLETGYIGVGETEEVQLFYYFVKSERNPEDDPLLLWLTGGPGCSSLTALAFELGPFGFKVVEYNGSLPTLLLNPNSWSKVSSIIFLDLPVGAGFSYAADEPAYRSSDSIQAAQAAQFIRKWLRENAEFQSNPLYIGGDSYAGIPLPVAVELISVGNEMGIEPILNLKSLETSCGGEYQNVKPTNYECANSLASFQESVSGLYMENILYPVCGLASPKPMDRMRFLSDRYQQQSLLRFDFPKFGCPTYPHLLSYFWADDEAVRKALHIRKDTVKRWIRCNKRSDYRYDVHSSFSNHVYLSTKGFRSLIYSGDHDLVIPSMGTQAWIRALNYSIMEEWRSWHVDGQVAGYTTTYSNGMTFATVKGAGHIAPEYKAMECTALFKRWINKESL
ncbi:Serine carboxypeptidase-like 18 [Linum grandiflorum]